MKSCQCIIGLPNICPRQVLLPEGTNTGRGSRKRKTLPHALQPEEQNHFCFCFVLALLLSRQKVFEIKLCRKISWSKMFVCRDWQLAAFNRSFSLAITDWRWIFHSEAFKPNGMVVTISGTNLRLAVAKAGDKKAKVFTEAAELLRGEVVRTPKTALTDSSRWRRKKRSWLGDSSEDPHQLCPSAIPPCTPNCVRSIYLRGKIFPSTKFFTAWRCFNNSWEGSGGTCGFIYTSETVCCRKLLEFNLGTRLMVE